MAFGFGTLWGGAAATSVASEGVQIHAIKAMVLNEVRINAGAGERPTLEAYRQAFMQNPDVMAMVADGQIKSENLNAIAADLSGQNLNGFKLTEPKAQEEFRQRQLATGRHDLYDQDGNHEINVAATSAFYDRIRLNGASLDGAWVEPASSFNDQIAKAKDRNNMTFHGLNDPNDPFVFPPGTMKDTKLTGIDGGAVTFAQGANAERVTLEGREASVQIDANARVSELSTNPGFRIVNLKIEPKGELANSDLRQTLVSMSSELTGAKLKDVQLGENVNGLDLSGAQIQDLSIGNRPIRSREQLAALGVTVDQNTQVTATAAFVQRAQMEAAMEAARKVSPVLGDALKTLAEQTEKVVAPQPQQAASQIEAPPISSTSIDRPTVVAASQSYIRKSLEHNSRADVIRMLASENTREAQSQNSQRPETATPAKFQVAHADQNTIDPGQVIAKMEKPAELVAAQAAAAASLPPRSGR